VTGDEALVRLEGGETCLAQASGTRPGDTVALVVRPEVIDIRPAGVTPGDAPVPALEGELVLSAYLGTSVSHRVQTDHGAILTVVVPRSHERLTSGDRVRVRWSAGDAKVLPRVAAAEEGPA